MTRDTQIADPPSYYDIERCPGYRQGGDWTAGILTAFEGRIPVEENSEDYAAGYRIGTFLRIACPHPEAEEIARQAAALAAMDSAGL